MIFNIDFDGTTVNHCYPEVGEDVPDAVYVLQQLTLLGHQLILWTMRSDTPEGNFLQDAVNWYAVRGIPLFGVNENPEQHTWTTSPKAYAHKTIDDNNVGCPLIQYAHFSRPCVLWKSNTQANPGIWELLHLEGIV